MAILAIATSMAVSVSGQPDKTSDQNQQPAKQGQPAVVTANSPNERSNGQTHQPQGSPDSPKWYAALERPDWWVVGFAFLTACVICWQSWETRKAARGAERAVEYETLGVRFCRDYGWHWLTGHWEEEDCRVYIGDRLIAGKWYEDDKQKNSERAKPN